MAEDAKEPVESSQDAQTPSAGEGGGGVNQDDIDAILKQAAQTPDADPPADQPEGGETPAPQAAAPEPEPEPSVAVNQSDIDALLQVAASGEINSEPAPVPNASQATAATPSQDDSGMIDQNALDALIAEAQGTAAQVNQEVAAVPADSAPMTLENLGEESSGEAVASVDLLQDVLMRVKIELGRSKMYVEDVLQLGKGSVVELDKLAGDPVDVFVNERLIAHGEVLVLNDSFCVRINEIRSAEMAT